MQADPKSTKRQSRHSGFFALLGKAAGKMLAKLMEGFVLISDILKLDCIYNNKITLCRVKFDCNQLYGTVRIYMPYCNCDIVVTVKAYVAK